MSDGELVRDLDGRLVTPEVARLYNKLRRGGSAGYDQLGVTEGRIVVERSAPLQGAPQEVAAVRDIRVAGSGGAIPVRLYTPAAPDDRGPGDSSPRGLLVYVHGGGWVTGGIESVDTTCRSVSNLTGFTVASVEYRLSPETPYPGPLDDVRDAVRALAALRVELGLPTDRLVAMGDSAGANLVAAATLGLTDLITDQVLFYPALVPPVEGDLSASYVENAADPILSRASMEWFWRQYLPTGHDAADPAVSPPAAAAAVLASLPRAFLVTCGLDVLRDEGRAYATALASAGVDVSAVHYPGLIHGFLAMAKFFPQAEEAQRRLAEWLSPTP